MRNISTSMIRRLRGQDIVAASVPLEPRSHCLACEASLIDDVGFLRLKVCTACGFHYTLTARERIEQFADAASFKELNASLISLDPLSFSNKSSYRDKLRQDQSRTGLSEAAVTGACTVAGRQVMLVVLDFSFLGGTMGAVVGEKVTLAFEKAAKRKIPMIAVITSGGTRMQEGVLSLMQMAKTTVAAKRFADKGLPFIAVLANPSIGQVFASVGNLADVLIAEPGALVGVSPVGSLENNETTPLSPQASTAEELRDHGMIDLIVPRRQLKDTISMSMEVFAPEFVLKARAASEVRENIVGDKTAWTSVEVSRHKGRPTSRDYIDRIFNGFVEMHGDRSYGDDDAVITGLGQMAGQGVVVIGFGNTRTDKDDKSSVNKISPEGLRKARRLMTLSSKFGLPVITFVDTPGIANTLDAENRGLGHALSTTIATMLDIQAPTVAVIVGEGGSEAALALIAADKILMMEYATLSPISPEGAAILFYADEGRSRQAAEDLRLTATNCYEMGIIDGIVLEPGDGAHEDVAQATRRLERAVLEQIAILQGMTVARLTKNRYEKFRGIGSYSSHFRRIIYSEVEQLQNAVAVGVEAVKKSERIRTIAKPIRKNLGKNDHASS
jgi:acetyl-CoA carboxylase carboxyl transferase alpha subunit